MQAQVQDEEAKNRENNSKSKSGVRVGGGRMQVAVLLAMPSPLRAKALPDHVGGDPSRCSFREELAIGLIQVPWDQRG
jgi:hypothetical protein